MAVSEVLGTDFEQLGNNPEHWGCSAFPHYTCTDTDLALTSQKCRHVSRVTEIATFFVSSRVKQRVSGQNFKKQDLQWVCLKQALGAAQ